MPLPHSLSLGVESIRMKKSIDWPTKRHKKFGEHIISICQANGIGLLLKGSIAKGSARPYSDIDISLYGNISKSIIEGILYGFEKPLMINASEKPPGLLVVAYCRGLSLDIDFRGDENINEKGKPILPIAASMHRHGVSDSTEEYLKRIGKNDRYSKISKLIHKGLLKYLNGERDDARGFIKEIAEFTNIQIDDQQELIEAFQTIVMALIEKEDITRQEFSWLIEEASRK